MEGFSATVHTWSAMASRPILVKKINGEAVSKGGRKMSKKVPLQYEVHLWQRIFDDEVERITWFVRQNIEVL